MMTELPRDRVSALQLANAATIVLIIYASLFPFTGWQAPSPAVWSRFLAAASAPQLHDLLGNVLFYVPSGFLLQLAARRWQATALALLALGALSLSLELTQGSLPARVPSVLDWTMNVLGACSGALTAALLQRAARHAPVGPLGWDAMDRARRGCLVVVVLWAAAQMAPFLPPISVERLVQAVQAGVAGGPERLASIAALREAVAVLIALLIGSRLLPPGSASRRSALVLIAVTPPIGATLLGTGLTAASLWGWALGMLFVPWVIRVPSRHWGPLVCGLVGLHLLPEFELPVGHMERPMNLVPLRPQLRLPLNGLIDILEGAWPYAALTAGLVVWRRDHHAAAGACAPLMHPTARVIPYRGAPPYQAPFRAAPHGRPGTPKLLTTRAPGHGTARQGPSGSQIPACAGMTGKNGERGADKRQRNPHLARSYRHATGLDRNPRRGNPRRVDKRQRIHLPLPDQHRQTGTLVAVALCGGLAFIQEWTQQFSLNHYPDITDALTALAGAGAVALALSNRPFR